MSMDIGGRGGSGGGGTPTVISLTTTLWVDAGVAVSGDGTLTTPYKTIQEALDLIQDATGKPSVADVKSGAWVPANLANYTTEDPPVVWVVHVVSGIYPEDIWIGPSRDINLIANGVVVLGNGDLADFGSSIPNSVVWHSSGGYNRTPTNRPSLRFTNTTPGEVSSTQPGADTGWYISGDIVAVQTVASDHNSSFYLENTKVKGDIDSTRKSTLPFNVYLKRFIVNGAVNIPNLGALQLAESGEIDGKIIAEYYGMLRWIEFTGDLEFERFQASLQPGGIYACYFKTAGIKFTRRDVAGATANLMLDATSNYFFTAAGGVLYEENPGAGQGVPGKVILHDDGNAPRYGEMGMHNNVVATTIQTVSTPHAIQGLFSAGTLMDWTFSAGSEAAITIFADAGGGAVTVTSALHGLANGDVVTIVGTTNYNGVFIISGVTANTFDITDTWLIDDATGTWIKGDKLVVGTGGAGVYDLTYFGVGSTPGGNKTFDYEVFINATLQNNIESSRKYATASDIGSFSSGGLVTVAEGDIVFFAITPITDTTDFTLKHLNITSMKI